MYARTTAVLPLLSSSSCHCSRDQTNPQPLYSSKTPLAARGGAAKSSAWPFSALSKSGGGRSSKARLNASNGPGGFREASPRRSGIVSRGRARCRRIFIFWGESRRSTVKS